MKHLVTLLAVIITNSVAFAGGPEAVKDLKEALAKAKSENKMLFVQMGRENCGNCQALKAMIKKGDVRLSPSKFVYADVNCDDAATNKLFSESFNVSGNILPFVAVASPDGAPLAKHSGYGTAQEFEKMIRDAGRAVKKTDAKVKP